MYNYKCISALLADFRKGAINTVPRIQGLDLDTQSLSRGLNFFHRLFLLRFRPEDSRTGDSRKHLFE